VHISEMSHTKRVLRSEDVVQKDEMVQVVIKSIDMDAKRISLSIKDALGDPWTGITTKYEINSIVQGILEKKEQFGLFISLEPGVTGLMLQAVKTLNPWEQWEIYSKKPWKRRSNTYFSEYFLIKLPISLIACCPSDRYLAK